MADTEFVVQEHTTAEGVHWDLMVKQGDVLATFRLDEGPPGLVEHPVRGEKILDHPLRFLTYEGPVQKGTGRVRIVDRGTCRLSRQAEDFMACALDGAILKGDFTLTRTEDAVWIFTLAGGRLGAGP